MSAKFVGPKACFVNSSPSPKVGIGTTAPLSALDVVGGIAIGTTYAGTTTAPANGAIIQGKVGVGTNGPTDNLHVYNNINGTAGITIENPNTGSSSNERLSFNNEDGSVAGIQLDDAASVYPSAMSIFNNRPSGNIRLNTGGSTKLFIANNGYLGIGTITPSYHLHISDPNAGAYVTFSENTYVGNSDGRGVYGKAVNNPFYGIGVTGEGGYIGMYGIGTGTTNGSTTYGVYGSSSGSTGTRIGIYGVASGGATNWAIYSAGNQFSSSGTLWSVSDQRFKNNIRPLTNALDILLKLEAKTYEYNKENVGKGLMLPEGKQYGFLAQDVEKIVPEAVMDTRLPVSPSQDEISANKNAKETYIDAKIYNSGPLLPISIQAIKELNAKLETELKKKDEQINGLEAKYNELLKRVSDLEKK